MNVDFMNSLVIIPTYNEAANVEAVISMVLNTLDTLDVLIVDDNSPDGTGAIADAVALRQPRVHVLHRPGKLGLGTAYIAGFHYAVNRKYEYVFEMDADLSHDPAYIPDMLSAIEGADLVIGSRYLTGVNVINWPMHRLLLSYFANMYARIVTGIPVRDLTSGFKCFRRRVLEALDLDAVVSEGYAFQIEMTFRCRQQGFQVREIPIVFTDRMHGATKMDKRVVYEAVLLVWKLRVLALMNRL